MFDVAPQVVKFSELQNTNIAKSVGKTRSAFLSTDCSVKTGEAQENHGLVNHEKAGSARIDEGTRAPRCKVQHGKDEAQKRKESRERVS